MATTNRLQIIIEAITRGMDNVDDASTRVQRLSVAATAVGAAFAGLAAAVYGAAQDIQRATNGLATALGIPVTEAERLAGVAKNIYLDNLAGSVEEAADIIEQAFHAMGNASDAELQKVASQAAMIRDAFGVDTAESISTAKTLMDNFGMSGEHAMDMIAAGYQKGLNRSGDFLDSLNEYAPQFKEAGADAGEFFSALETGLQGGMLGTDKISDLFKEFRVRIQDGSDATAAALRKIGIDTDAMLQSLADGSLSVTDALAEVQNNMAGVEDSGTRMQAGVALLGTQFEDLGYDAFAALDLTATKMEDLSGASDKLKQQYQDIGSILQGTWRAAQAGLFKLVDLVNWGIKTFQQLDGSAQVLLATLTAYTVIFAAWKLGLGAMVLGIQRVILDLIAMRAAAIETQVALGGLQAQFMAASLAMKAGLVIAVVWTGMQVYEAVKAFMEMREAQEMAAEASQRVMDKTQAAIDRYGQFKDVTIPKDLTRYAQEDLEMFNGQLVKSRAYWQQLKIQLEEKSRETNLFGNLTDEAKAAQAEIVNVDARLKEISAEMNRLNNVGGMEKPAEAVRASVDEMAKFEEAAKKAYDEASKAAEKYANEVIAWEEKIKMARMSTEDRIRALQRKAMSDDQAWRDEQLQAEQKLADAKAALKEGDYKLAEKLAKDAEGLYAGLAREVKEGTGKDSTVVQTIQQTKDAAVAGVSEVGKFIESVYTEQKDAAEKMRDGYQDQAGKLKADLDEIAKAREAKVTILLENFNEMKKHLEDLTAPATKKVTVEMETVEKKAVGGPVGLARGGGLPGYGGGDRVPAVLEAGEWVIRKEAVRRYGAGLFHALNSLRAPNLLLSKLQLPAPNAVPRVAYASGGPVGGGLDMSDLGRVEIAVGGKGFPVMGKVDVIGELKKALKREQLLKTK